MNAKPVAGDPMPTAIVPMLAKAGQLPSKDSDFAFEIKWDGIRAIAYVTARGVRLQSRNVLDLTPQYPEIQPLATALTGHEVVLDGELVAFDKDGKPSFQRLQGRMGATGMNVEHGRTRIPAQYQIFDLLYLNGRSLMSAPYVERREQLEALSLNGDAWSTPAYHVGDGELMMAAVREQGLEGVIIKRLASRYEPGKRSGAWMKVKNIQSQELLIGGWTPGAGNRAGTIGALLLGHYDEAQQLQFAGKVGTGFTGAFLKELLPKLQRLERAESPFDVGTPERGSRFVEPQLVAQVSFTEWTEAGTLRHPSFLGLREDRPANEVRRKPLSRQPAATEPSVEPASPAEGITRQATVSGKKMSLMVEDHDLNLSNLEKVMYPATGFTKGEVIDYNAAVAPFMLPHIKGRPMTLKRYPNGVSESFFYEKKCPVHRPPWVHTATVAHRGTTVNYCLVEDLPTLIWLANLATLEMHPLLSRAEDSLRPTSVVFDLDPGAPADVIDCCEVALLLREVLARHGLQLFPKTSGSKGLQVYLPLNTPTSYDETKPFALAVAQLLEGRQSRRITSTMSKAARPGRVFIDWSQNDEHKTTVAVYSLRAREQPTVSTPLTWDEVQAAAAHRDAARLRFEAQPLLARMARIGDFFAPLLSLEQRLPPIGDLV